MQSLQLAYKYIISMVNMTALQAITIKDTFIFSLATSFLVKRLG